MPPCPWLFQHSCLEVRKAAGTVSNRGSLIAMADLLIGILQRMLHHHTPYGGVVVAAVAAPVQPAVPCSRVAVAVPSGVSSYIPFFG